MVKLTSAAIVSRSTLRDVLNRLRKIRQTCGAEEEEGAKAGSGDPFKDQLNRFMKSAKEVREMIVARNDEAQKGQAPPSDIAQKSHDINVETRNLKAELIAIEALCEAAVKDFARSNVKIAKIEKKGGEVSKEKRDKQQARMKAVQERESAVTSCRQVLESLAELNQQRFLTQKEVRQMKDQPANAKKAPRMRQTLAERMRLDKQRKERKERNGGEDEEDDAAPGKKLEDDPETAQHMKDLAKKQKQQDDALNRIAAAMGRITDNAIAIGQELDAQDQALQDAEDKADKATKDLKGINRSLNKMLKEQKPMNMFINVMCFLLIVGLLGFFLDQFGAIPS